MLVAKTKLYIGSVIINNYILFYQPVYKLSYVLLYILTELPVCADINPSPAPDKVLILWAHLKLPNCGVQAEDELISVSPVGAIGGYLMDNIVSDKQYNISIKCIGGEVKKSGAVHFRIG